jgi:flagellum-specific ATP synthase
MNRFINKTIQNIAQVKGGRKKIFSGKVTKYDGNTIECSGFPATIGTLCKVLTDDGKPAIAEIIGFSNGNNLAAMHQPNSRVLVGSEVVAFDDGYSIPVGPGILGRVIDALGQPLDGNMIHQVNESWPLAGEKINPLDRTAVEKPLDVGVRVINSLLTVGKGQRLGIIAGSGVGKSVLLGMITRFTTADIVVVGLIGERGREVGNFVSSNLNEDTKKRTVMVVEPADRSPLLRIRAANRATAIAEYFRDKGKDVLLIMDSLTRVAHARREIGLALGEQPTSKGYPPSVISLIPTLIERTGSGSQGKGTITAFYTILADGDDQNDPVVDTSRAILDGHIMLSRDQAQKGIYPAVDVSSSVSRVMNEIVDNKHIEASIKFRQLVTTYNENKDLLMMGGYTQGQDQTLDQAISLWPKITECIKQQENKKESFSSSNNELMQVFGN